MGTEKIGIAVTTRNRPEVLERCLEHMLKFRPSTNVVIVVVDDNSDTKGYSESLNKLLFSTTYIYNQEQLGIARSKNRCIKELMSWKDIDHFFLFDDDAWPVGDNWWRPYIESSQPHLMAIFPHKTESHTPLQKYAESWDTIAYTGSRGYMLYLERRVVEKVGGMDPDFKFGFEHVEYSNRIYNAGLTLFRYQDAKIPPLWKRIYSADGDPESNLVESSIDDFDKRVNTTPNLELLESYKDRKTYVPYTDPRQVVFSCLLTRQEDPQRGFKWSPDLSRAAKLAQSLKIFDQTLQLYLDEPSRDTGKYEGLTPFDTTRDILLPVQSEYVKNPYFKRWAIYKEALLDDESIEYVWCVDATDVEALKPPFQTPMEKNRIYCGWENKTVRGDFWLWNNHEFSRPWLNSELQDQTLFNAGVVGGHRDTIIKLCSIILDLYAQSVHLGQDELGDMPIFNRAVRSFEKITSGPSITTLFKGEQRNNWSIWKHK